MLKVLAGWERFTYTILLFMTEIALGMVNSVYSPIMVDMKYILNTSMKWVSLFTTFETIGYILGTFVGLLYKYINRQIVISLFFIVLTIASATIPLLPNLWVLLMCATIIGFSASVYTSGSTVWMIELWRGKNIPILQIYELWYGVGYFLTNITLKPYLVGETHSKQNETITPDNFELHQDEFIDRRGRLMIPTLLIGASIIILPIAVFTMYFIKPYKVPDEIKEDDQAKNLKLFDREETPRKTIRILFALWFAVYMVFETIFMKFCVTYFQYSPLRLSAEKATEILSVGVAVYTAGLGMNIITAYKISINHILSAHYVIMTIGFAIFIPARNSLVLTWVATIVLLYGFSAMFAGIIAFAEQYLDLTNKMTAMFLMVRGIITLVTPLIVGEYIENFSMIFIYVEVFYLICALIVFITINVFIKKYSHLTTSSTNSLTN